MRVLVDGYSLLHSWKRFTNRKTRSHSLQHKRDALIRILQQYADHTGHRVTLVFDAYAAKHKPDIPEPTPGVEVIYSDKGKTADEAIERTVGEASQPAQILVVTSDNLERTTVESLGARSMSGDLFEMEVNAAVKDLDTLVRRYGPRQRGSAAKVGDAFDE